MDKRVPSRPLAESLAREVQGLLGGDHRVRGVATLGVTRNKLWVEGPLYTGELSFTDGMRIVCGELELTRDSLAAVRGHSPEESKAATPTGATN